MSKGRENKPHIGIFGRRNSGKSSLINALTQQNIAIVSETPGTTTDPVRKSMEIAGIGPAILVDTAGVDDVGSLGELRKKKTFDALRTIDLALLLITGNRVDKFDRNLMLRFRELDVPFLIVHNKSDIETIKPQFKKELAAQYHTAIVDFSALNPVNLQQLIEAITQHIPTTSWQKPPLLGDLLTSGDIVLLITPIDTEAPEGRMILPQVQAIRDILDNNCVAIVLKENELVDFLRQTGIKPKLAITDSQVFPKADAAIPKDIPLTSFSIMLARHKGDFANYLKGTPKISSLNHGDRILILESCTHHVSCDDIGRIKIPRWLSDFTHKKLDFDVVAGLDNPPRPIEEYALVIQCGGCMITRKQLMNRLNAASSKDIPVTNYGMTIAYVHGIYQRAIAPFV